MSGTPQPDPALAMHYMGGYSVLLVPAYWISHDPTTVYRTVLAENAVLSSLLYPLCYLLGSLVLGLRRRIALAASFGLAALPGVVFYTQLALTDALLPVVVTAWLLSVGLWVRGGPRSGLCATSGALLVAFVVAIHARGVVLAALELGLLTLVAVRAKPFRRSAVVALVALIVGVGIAGTFNSWTATQNSPNAVPPFVLTSYHETITRYGDVALRTLGSLWASGVATLGLTFVTFTAGAWAAVRRGIPIHQRVVVLLTLAATVGVAAASSFNAVQAGDEHRVGNWAYSRYIACFVPALIMIGIWALVRRSSRGARSTAVAVAVGLAAFAATAFAFAVLAGHRLTDYTFVQFDFPETMPLTGSWHHLDVVGATVVAMALLALAVVMATRSGGAAVILVLSLGVGMYSDLALESRVVHPWEAQYWPKGRTLFQAAQVRPPMKVGAYGVGFMEWSQLTWESYWRPVPIVWNVGLPIAGYDVIAIPRDASPAIMQVMETRLTTNGWRREWADYRWKFWVPPGR